MKSKYNPRDDIGYFTFFLKALLYISLALVFFLILSIDNPQVMDFSRTAAVVTLTFSVLIIVLMSAYGGYAIGKQKSKPIIYSMCFATALTDLIAWLQLLIMNVNPANRPHFMITGLDALGLFLTVFIQTVIIILFTYLGNYLYFKLIPPENCCVIARDEAAAARVIAKIRRFKYQFKVAAVLVPGSENECYAAITSCDSAFLYGLPPNMKEKLVEYCYANNKSVYFGTEVYDVIENSATHVVLDDLSFLGLIRHELSLEQRFIKRVMDITGSVIALIAFSPLMAVSALAIWLEDRGPVIYRQPRYTRNNNIFTIYKFRTMKPDADNGAHISAFENDMRITRVGKVLRRIRMDEMPQFFNILKGDMSIVGPRPEMLENSGQYIGECPEFAYRLRVKAGLTGYAQIVGKYNTPAKDKMILDLMYITKYSVWLDIKLLLRTPTVFFKPDSTQGFQNHKKDAERVREQVKRVEAL